MNIEARGLGKTYTSGGRPLPVLQDVDLIVEAETSVAIVGPSGSGKTTLLGLLAGLDVATTGTVRLGGQSLAELNEDQRAEFRARHTGFVFQTFHLLPTLTALENVQLPMFEIDVSRAERIRRAERLLQLAAIGHRAGPCRIHAGNQPSTTLASAKARRPP